MATAQQSRFALLALGLGTSLPAADTAVNAALPAIADALLNDPMAIRWIVVIYVLTYASLMMLLGAWGDRQGYWRVFRLGLWIGAFAYAWCALASSYSELLSGRLLQGISSALLLSVGPALMVQCLGAAHQSRAIAAYGALSSLAAALGPLVGGMMIEQLGWAGTFWFRLPCAAFAILCLLLASQQAASRSQIPGPAYQARAMLKRQSAAGLENAANFVSLMHSLGVHCRGQLLKAHALHAWAQVCGFTSMLLIPFFITNILHQTPTFLGVILFAWPLGMVIGNSLGPRLIRQLPPAMCFRVGLLLLALGGCGLAAICLGFEALHEAFWSIAASSWALSFSLLIQGIGLGLFQMLYTDWVLDASEASQRGLAGAASLTSRTVGIVLTALLWPELIEAVRNQFSWAWSSALGLLYLLGALSLLALLSQIPPQSIRIPAHSR